MDLTLWLAFVSASVVLLIIPGPTLLLVISYSLSQGRRVALASAAGVALGDFIAMSASLAGLGAIVLTSAVAFTVLKWVGALYLIYLGLKMWRGAGDAALSAPSAPVQSSAVFRDAAFVTALNPKSISFFIAFVPQFITAERPLLPQFAILIASFVGLAALNAVTAALLADRFRASLARPNVTGWLTRAGGLCLVVLGLATATLRRA